MNNERIAEELHKLCGKKVQILLFKVFSIKINLVGNLEYLGNGHWKVTGVLSRDYVNFLTTDVENVESNNIRLDVP